jgi:hypothetical protein
MQWTQSILKSFRLCSPDANMEKKTTHLPSVVWRKERRKVYLKEEEIRETKHLRWF